MSQFVGDVIIIEFANTIMESVKKLRQDIKSELDKEIPLIRIKDNIDLDENEYKILIKEITVKQELIENDNANEKATIILEALKETLICNIHSIT